VDQKDIKIRGPQVQVYYGDTHAIKDVDVDIEDKTVTAFIGPSGCGKSTFLRCLNRMNDTIDVCRSRATSSSTARTSTTRGRPGAAARQGRHGVPEAQPVPEVDLRQRRLRPAHPRLAKNKAELTRSSRNPAPRRALGRGQGPARRARHRPVGRPAAAPVHRPRRRHRARSAADGRALLGARPDRHRAGRGTDRRAAQNYSVVIVTHSMQQAARVSQKTAFFHLGNLVEYGDTDRSSPTPRTRAPKATSPAGSAEGRPNPHMTHQHIAAAFDRDLEAIQALDHEDGRAGRGKHPRRRRHSLENRDEELAEKVRAGDKRDRRAGRADQRGGARVIALRQPIASTCAPC
jgi:phosphate transport system ATP-binding protein